MKVFDTTVKLATVPLKLTFVVPVRLLATFPPPLVELQRRSYGIQLSEKG